MLLTKVKLLLGITANDKDDLLTLLIDNATEEAMAYTRQENAEVLNTAIIQMVVYMYNRLGTEGLDAESYSNVRFDYSASYPDSIMAMLNSKRKMVIV